MAESQPAQGAPPGEWQPPFQLKSAISTANVFHSGPVVAKSLESLEKAVCWLTGAIMEERSLRVQAAEGQTTPGATVALDLSVTGNESKDVAQLRNAILQIDRRHRQREAELNSREEILEFKFTELQRHIAARPTETQILEIHRREVGTRLQEGLSAEFEALRQRLDRIHEETRKGMSMMDQRVDGLEAAQAGLHAAATPRCTEDPNSQLGMALLSNAFNETPGIAEETAEASVEADVKQDRDAAPARGAPMMMRVVQDVGVKLQKLQERVEVLEKPRQKGKKPLQVIPYTMRSHEADSSSLGTPVVLPGTPTDLEPWELRDVIPPQLEAELSALLKEARSRLGLEAESAIVAFLEIRNLLHHGLAQRSDSAPGGDVGLAVSEVEASATPAATAVTTATSAPEEKSGLAKLAGGSNAPLTQEIQKYCLKELEAIRSLLFADFVKLGDDIRLTLKLQLAEAQHEAVTQSDSRRMEMTTTAFKAEQQTSGLRDKVLALGEEVAALQDNEKERVLSIKTLSQEIARLKRLVEERQMSDGFPKALNNGLAGAKDDASKMALEFQDDFRRVKCRLDYLERMMPDDMKKALTYFEPMQVHVDARQYLAISGSDEGDEGAVILKKISDIQAKQQQSVQTALGLAEDGRREVTNLTAAVRGVQRDRDITVGNLDAVRRQTARLEAAMPNLLQLLEKVFMRIGDVAQGDVLEDAAAECRRLLASPLVEVEPSKLFATEAMIHDAIADVRKDFKLQLEKLRKDIDAALSSKAVSEEVRLHLEMLKLKINAVTFRSEAAVERPGTTGMDAAMLRYPLVHQGRCASCNTKMDVITESAGPWPTRSAVPSTPPFPARALQKPRRHESSLKHENSAPALLPPVF